MYCKHCGKQIIDDSLYCCFCGCKQDSIISNNDSNDTNEKLPIGIEEEQLEEHVQKEEKTITISNWSYLGRRLMGTIIDKIAILSIFILFLFGLFCFNYDSLCDMRVYGELFHMTPKMIHEMAIGYIMDDYPYNSTISQHQFEIDEFFSYLLGTELKITYLFVLIYIIYYYWLENTLGVSFGKYLFRLKLVNIPYVSGKKIATFKVFMRALSLFVLISMIIVLRWIIGFNYYVVIVLFFLLLDLPVLIWNKSLQNIVSCTRLVYEPDIHKKL